MRRTILRAVFLMAAVLVGQLGGCTSQEEKQRQAIERVLKEDFEVSIQVIKDLQITGLDAEAALLRSVDAMTRIELEGCPPEFADAFRTHVEAWEDAARYVLSQEDPVAAAEEMLVGYTGNIGAAMQRANRARRGEASEVDRLHMRIMMTNGMAWNIAKQHDVNPNEVAREASKGEGIQFQIIETR